MVFWTATAHEIGRRPPRRRHGHGRADRPVPRAQGGRGGPARAPRSSSARRRRWRRSAGSPAASPTTSTTCSPSSSATASCCCRELPEDTAPAATLDAIQQAGERAAALTRQLLAFSRKQVLAARSRSTSTRSWRASTPMLRRLIGEDVELVIAPRRRRSARVRADPGQLEQVIMNLAVNARDAMPQRRPAHDRDRATSSSTPATRGAHPGARRGPHVHARGQRHRHRHGRRRRRRASSSRSSRPRSRARAPASAWPPSTASSSRAAAASSVYSEPGQGTTFKIYLPRPTRRRERAWPRSARGRPMAPGGCGDDPARRGRGRTCGSSPATSCASAGYTVLDGRGRRRRRCGPPRPTAADPPAAHRRGHAGRQRPRAGRRAWRRSGPT